MTVAIKKSSIPVEDFFVLSGDGFAPPRAADTVRVVLSRHDAPARKHAPAHLPSSPWRGDNAMMGSLCRNCGEELIGAVNRCWQCGTSVAIPRVQEVPPVRRSPVDLGKVEATAAPATAVPTVTARPGRISGRTRQICAYASVWIGAVACLIGLGSVWAIVPATAAMALGVLGMRAQRRDLATTGLIISVLALFLGFAQIGIGIWTKHQSQQLIDGFQDQPF